MIKEKDLRVLKKLSRIILRRTAARGEIMKKALWILGITAVVWIVADVVFEVSGDNTISQAMKWLGQKCSTFPLIIGLLVGHFFWTVPKVNYRRVRNILLIGFFIWFGFDLFNGISDKWSVAGSGYPMWIMSLIGIGIGRLLWPQGE